MDGDFPCASDDYDICPFLFLVICYEEQLYLPYFAMHDRAIFSYEEINDISHLIRMPETYVVSYMLQQWTHSSVVIVPGVPEQQTLQLSIVTHITGPEL